MNLKQRKYKIKVKRGFISLSISIILAVLLASSGCGKSTSSANSGSSNARGDFIAFIAAPVNNSALRVPVKEECQNGEVVTVADNNAASHNVVFTARIVGAQEPFTETWQIYGLYDLSWIADWTSAAGDDDATYFFIKDDFEGWYDVVLTVRDVIGRVATDSIRVRIYPYYTELVTEECPKVE